ncbi:uncharacterized protein LOC132748038 [Ruditapes philippinarum]|uniref:uncharacterized protein LOC132748038 n=1 Tax=Ruditapes philippinarum TaxID=129788 RepID=UPI00295B0981|nr:uncharacterized protein LOC132748038 [Ruditapes philippinarum]
MAHVNVLYYIICNTLIMTVVVALHQNQNRNSEKQNSRLYFMNHYLNQNVDINTISDNGATNEKLKTNKDTVPDFKIENYDSKNTEKLKHRDEYELNIDEDVSINEDCNINVENTSINYFGNVLISEPYLVKFKIFLKGNATVRSLSSTFKPLLWFWTPNTTVGPYPFLSWKIDYGIVSFGLLDTNTVDIPFINVHVKGNCNFTFGTNDTSHKITKALGQMLQVHNHPTEIILFSYFCYMRVREDLMNTSHYYASLYIIFPIQYVSYNCCTAKKNYNKTEIEYNCTDTTMDNHNWDQISILPFYVGLLLLAYCPIHLSDLCAWMTKHENIPSRSGTLDDRYDNNKDDWVFENGNNPLTFFELLSFSVFGLDISHPVLVSRLRRFLFLLLAPSVLYFQLFLYRNGIGISETDKITVKELVDIGAPMGFLSIFGNPENRGMVFVPYLGGPVGLAIIYLSLGIVFIVMPRHLKQIFEDGLPSGCSNEDENVRTRNKNLISPLLFRNDDIINLSRVSVSPEQLHGGYTSTATLMRCSIYMLFTKSFWGKVLQIQKKRILSLKESTAIYKKAMFIFSIPLYAVACVIETLCCILYYGLPFCFYVVVVVKGASKGLANLRDQIGCLSFIFKFRILEVVGVVIVFILSSAFAYVIALIFLKSFAVLSQIFILCFISIIIFPSVSFGYIFFFTAALYFCLHQIRNFEEVYANLLSTAVEVSDRIEGYSNNVSFLNNRLNLSNVRYENIKDIRINGNVLDISQNVLRTIHLHGNSRIREVNNTMGIPKKLFDHLIRTYRPVHQQVLSFIFKVFAMASLIIVTLSITSDYVKGPTSKISEVMHVIFFIAVGALPELIEVTVSYRDDEHVKKEIEERKMEQTIREFWRHNQGIQN